MTIDNAQFPVPLTLAAAAAVLLGYVNLTFILPVFANTFGPDLTAMAIQFSLGAILSFIHPRKWVLLALLTGVLPLAISLFGIVTDLEKHNLWPIELVFGVLFVVPALVGAWIARLARRKFFE